MAKKIINICDGPCGDESRETQPYAVSDGNKRKAKIDLCSEDAAVFEKYLPSRVGRPPASGRGPGRPRKPKVDADA